MTPLILTGITTTVGVLSFVFGFVLPRRQAARERRRVCAAKRSESLRFLDDVTVNAATEFYLQPECTSIDPSREVDARSLLATKQPAFSLLDEFTSRETQYAHLFVLADSGMGKTSLLMRYVGHYCVNDAADFNNIVIIPLGSDQALDRILSLPAKSSTVLLLDALDESKDAIEKFELHFNRLLATIREFPRVVITCRTQFFLADQEIPIESGVVAFGARRLGEGNALRFWKVYLCAFDTKRVHRYLELRGKTFDDDKLAALEWLVTRLPELAIRPMVLAYLPDIIDRPVIPTRLVDIYAEIVNAWLERERPWVEPSKLKAFSEKLAWNMFADAHSTRGQSIHFSILQQLSNSWGIPLERWQLTGRSLLNRDNDGNYKFSHRSIMEYFVACVLAAGGERIGPQRITDLILQFLLELRQSGTNVDLKLVDFAELELRGLDLSDCSLRECIFDLGVLDKVSFARAQLSNGSFKRAEIKACTFENANLSGVKFDGASLTGCVLRRTNLKGASFAQADVRGTDFGESDLSETDFSGALYDKQTIVPREFEKVLERASLKYEGVIISLVEEN